MTMTLTQLQKIVRGDCSARCWDQIHTLAAPPGNGLMVSLGWSTRLLKSTGVYAVRAAPQLPGLAARLHTAASSVCTGHDVGS